MIRFTFACANGRLTCFGSFGLFFMFLRLLGFGFHLGGVLIHLFLVVALVVLAIDLTEPTAKYGLKKSSTNPGTMEYSY